jgi:hypothetical protein
VLLLDPHTTGGLAIGAAAGFDWSVVGSRHLKGISGELKLYRVSRLGL